MRSEGTGCSSSCLGIVGCERVRKLLEKLSPNLEVCIVVDVPNPKGLSTPLPKEVTGDAVISRPGVGIESQNLANSERVAQRRKALANAIMFAACERALSPGANLDGSVTHDG